MEDVGRVLFDGPLSEVAPSAFLLSFELASLFSLSVSSGFNFPFGWNDLSILLKLPDLLNCNVQFGTNVLGTNFFVLLGSFPA